MLGDLLIATTRLDGSDRIVVRQSGGEDSGIAPKATVTTHDAQVCEIEMYSDLTELRNTLERKLRGTCKIEEAKEAISALQHIIDQEP
jgi:hypothetical protein